MILEKLFRISMALLATAVLFLQLYIGADSMWLWFARAS